MPNERIGSIEYWKESNDLKKKMEGQRRKFLGYSGYEKNDEIADVLKEVDGRVNQEWCDPLASPSRTVRGMIKLFEEKNHQQGPPLFPIQKIVDSTNAITPIAPEKMEVLEKIPEVIPIVPISSELHEKSKKKADKKQKKIIQPYNIPKLEKYDPPDWMPHHLRDTFTHLNLANPLCVGLSEGGRLLGAFECWQEKQKLKEKEKRSSGSDIYDGSSSDIERQTESIEEETKNDDSSRWLHYLDKDMIDYSGKGLVCKSFLLSEFFVKLIEKDEDNQLIDSLSEYLSPVQSPSLSKGLNSTRNIDTPFVALPFQKKVKDQPNRTFTVEKDVKISAQKIKRKLHEPRERRTTWEERKKLGAEPNVRIQPHWFSELEENEDKTAKPLVNKDPRVVIINGWAPNDIIKRDKQERKKWDTTIKPILRQKEIKTEVSPVVSKIPSRVPSKLNNIAVGPKKISAERRPSWNSSAKSTRTIASPRIVQKRKKKKKKKKNQRNYVCKKGK